MTTATVTGDVTVVVDMLVTVALVFSYAMVRVHFRLFAAFIRSPPTPKHLHLLLINLINMCSRMLESRDCELTKGKRRRL